MLEIELENNHKKYHAHFTTYFLLFSITKITFFTKTTFIFQNSNSLNLIFKKNLSILQKYIFQS